MGLDPVETKPGEVDEGFNPGVVALGKGGPARQVGSPPGLGLDKGNRLVQAPGPEVGARVAHRWPAESDAPART